MSCAGCATSVESMLLEQEGVKTASVNFATTTAVVEYLPNSTSVVSFQKALQSIGFDLVIEEDATLANEIAHQKSEENYETLKTKTIGALLFSLPVMVISMFFMNWQYANYITWFLTTPVVFFYGKSFFINAFKQARNGKANMDTLVAVSTSVSYIFSVFTTLFPHYWHRRGLHPHVYFEAAAVVIAFVLLGKLLEANAKGNTSTALKKLMGLQPKTVIISTPEGIEKEILIREVAIGNTILVKPGQKIAVDGSVLSGESYVDESMITGEPIAVHKTTGTAVYAGTINQKGSFKFIAEKVGEETLLAQIVHAVREAQGSKAPIQKLVDKIASIFVPVVILIASAAFVLWLIFANENAFTYALLAFVTVLVIACPCALGLATPTAIMVGIGKAAENGILIKDAESLEKAPKITTIVLDKTGTLTKGTPAVMAVHWKNKTEENLDVLLALEKRSEHPLASAIVAYFSKITTQSIDIQEFENISGEGVTAKFENDYYLVGNKKMMLSHGVTSTNSLETVAAEQQKSAKTMVYFAKNNELLAVISLADEMKETSKQAVFELQKAGIEVIMLTGDTQEAARSVAEEVGITNVKASVLPNEKADFVKQLQAQGKYVAMVGDGINDSTALAQADVSIAMGKGADIAMEVAQMTIISSDLLKISDAIRLSKRTVKIIRQNLFWAFIYNLIGIPIAAGVLYFFNGFLLNPMWASAAMALSSISVVTNSLRLKNNF